MRESMKQKRRMWKRNDKRRDKKGKRMREKGGKSKTLRTRKEREFRVSRDYSTLETPGKELIFPRLLLLEKLPSRGHTALYRPLYLY